MTFIVSHFFATFLVLVNVFVDAAAIMDIEASLDGQRFIDLFKIPRNRRAAQAAFIVMFMQQFCGINAVAYYSTEIFKQANFSDKQAFLASFGFGAGAKPSWITVITY